MLNRYNFLSKTTNKIHSQDDRQLIRSSNQYVATPRRALSNIYQFDALANSRKNFLLQELQDKLDVIYQNRDSDSDFSYETPPYSPRENIKDIMLATQALELESQALLKEIAALEKQAEALSQEIEDSSDHDEISQTLKC